jgi:hypothetical protein
VRAEPVQTTEHSVPSDAFVGRAAELAALRSPAVPNERLFGSVGRCREELGQTGIEPACELSPAHRF